MRARKVQGMLVRVGCQFDYESPAPTPSVWQTRPRPDGPHRVISHTWDHPGHSRSYIDVYGNCCDRLVLPEGPSTVRYDALVEVPAAADEADEEAVKTPIEALPDEALIYLLSSRFCWPELLCDQAWALFGQIPSGWRQAQAVCDWVHEHIRFEVGTSTTLTTAQDVWESRTGVCRDFTHLAITLCRGLNIPARYVAGYLPDIHVPPPDLPMDFCSWLEAWIDDRWWTFDPRNNTRRIGRVVIGRGRDALDVAMATTYGAPRLRAMTVWADEVHDNGA